jgi:hypothetical protein
MQRTDCSKRCAIPVCRREGARFVRATLNRVPHLSILDGKTCKCRTNAASACHLVDIMAENGGSCCESPRVLGWAPVAQRLRPSLSTHFVLRGGSSRAFLAEDR